MTTDRTIAVLEPGYADYRQEQSILAGLGVRIAAIAAEDDAIPSLERVNPLAIMVRERPVTAEVIDTCPDLKVIVRYGVGVDNVDIARATERRIYVANVPDYGADIEVSEHALALYLAVQRRVLSRDREVREGKWGIGQAAVIPSRENAALGLIGCGRIGIAAARKFRAIGFERVVAFDPYLKADTALRENIEQLDLDELCRIADVVSLHAPLTAQTRHILDAERIGLLKPTTVLVNVSRGGLVDEAALAAALEAGRLLGAGIDVFETEPIRANNPLLSSPNTVLSDHAAWYSERSVRTLQAKAAEEVARVLRGDTPTNWLNRWTP